MRQRLARFMIGRNGPDPLFRFTSYLSIIILLGSMLFGAAGSQVGFLLALALIGYTYFRVLSKNLSARRAENAKYLRFKQSFTDWFKLRRDIWRQRKDYKFFSCSSCKAMLRVPRGKGRIRIVCKKCGAAFERKT